MEHSLHQICKAIKESSDYLLYGENKDIKKENTDKEVLLEIINRCNEEELKVLKDVASAIFPDFQMVIKRKHTK